MEDYDRYMDERGHEACAQMLARNSARDGAESLPALHISEDGMCARVEVDLLEHARAVLARRLAEMGQAAFDEELLTMGYVRIDGGTEGTDMDGYLGELSRMRLEVELMRSENAKLRKLVRQMHSELVSCEENEYICGGHKFDEDVRELGVDI